MILWGGLKGHHIKDVENCFKIPFINHWKPVQKWRKPSDRQTFILILKPSIERRSRLKVFLFFSMKQILLRLWKLLTVNGTLCSTLDFICCPAREPSPRMPREEVLGSAKTSPVALTHSIWQSCLPFPWLFSWMNTKCLSAVPVKLAS